MAQQVGSFLLRLYFDPLSAFPGPFLARVSNLPYSKSYLGGRQPFDVLALHEKYGDVVRVAPNELSFSSIKSWHDIYGANPGRLPLNKSNFYEGGGFGGKVLSIVSERDPAKHHEMRKYLSAVFSEHSLKRQENLIARVIDQFIKSIGEDKPDPIDMTRWFNLLTFDTIAELAFGQSFGGVNNGEVHPWVSVVLSSLGQFTWRDTLIRFPLLGKIFVRLNPSWELRLLEAAREHENYAKQMVVRYGQLLQEKPSPY